VAEWERSDSISADSTYEAHIQILTEDKIGVIAAISQTLADMRVSISSINTQMQKSGDVIINIIIECKNKSHYDAIVSKIRSVSSVISVTRGFSN
jgi:guanosine-3',5'-bis(diphosphate) 3'-pyrophosphohydrolase